MKGFVATVGEVRDGQSLIELGEQLLELVAAVRETGRPGKLTYVIAIKPASKGTVNTLLLEDQIKVSRPTLERGSTIFFATNENTLQRNDPRQPELKGLRDVTQHPRAAREEASQS